MTERERTVIRLAGLVVHALGLVGIVAALAGAPWPPVWAGVVLFLVGGAWGWGMVALAAHEAADQARRDENERMARERMAGAGRHGFSSRFDDEVEPPLITPGIPPPPGGP